MPEHEENFDAIFHPEDGYISRAEAKKVAKDEVSKTLRDINTFTYQAQAGVANAIREITAVHADFEERRPQMMAVLEQIPLLRDAVASAESNPQLSPTLPQIYEVIYRASQAPSPAENAPTASEPSLGTQADLSDENTQYRSALASQQVSLSPENRKVLISSLERHGVLDVPF